MTFQVPAGSSRDADGLGGTASVAAEWALRGAGQRDDKFALRGRRHPLEGSDASERKQGDRTGADSVAARGERVAEFMQQDWLQTVRWLRVIGDTIFAAGTLALGWFVLGLKTGWSVREERDLPAR